MRRGLTITKEVHFRRANRGRRVIEEGAVAKTPDLGSVPRVSRLMALAIYMEDLVRRDEVVPTTPSWPASRTLAAPASRRS